MAGFRTHIGTSTLVGIGYGAAGYALGIPPTSCLLAGGLCGLAGMLPDLDSDSGVPVRETMALAAAVIPVLLVRRLERHGLDHESIVLAAAIIYLAVRFGLAEVFKRYTVHRGMWHSVPAMVSVGLVAFLLTTGPDVTVRLFKTGAVMLGFFVHLLLDEIWSIQFRGLRLKFKKSFGTAIKFWGKSTWGNISTYAKLALLAALVACEIKYSPELRPLAEQLGLQPVSTRFGREAHQARELQRWIGSDGLERIGVDFDAIRAVPAADLPELSSRAPSPETPRR